MGRATAPTPEGTPWGRGTKEKAPSTTDGALAMIGSLGLGEGADQGHANFIAFNFHECKLFCVIGALCLPACMTLFLLTLVVGVSQVSGVGQRHFGKTKYP